MQSKGFCAIGSFIIKKILLFIIFIYDHREVTGKKRDKESKGNIFDTPWMGC